MDTISTKKLIRDGVRTLAAAGVMLAVAAESRATLYSDFAEIMTRYHIGVQTSWTRVNTTWSFPFRDKGSLMEFADNGSGLFLGYGSIMDSYETNISARLSNRLSMRWDIIGTLPYDAYPETGATDVLFTNDSSLNRLAVDYQLSPRNVFYAMVEDGSIKTVYNSTQKIPATMADYWIFLLDEKDYHRELVKLGTTYSPNWGYVDVSGYTEDIYSRSGLPIESQSALTNLQLHTDEHNSQLVGGKLVYRLNPLRNMDIAGVLNIEKTNSITQSAGILDLLYYYYPITMKYRFSDKWELEMGSDNTEKTWEYSPYKGQTSGSVFDAQTVTRDSNRDAFYKMRVGINRYFKYEGITLSLKFYRNNWTKFYLNDPKTFIAVDYSALTKYWDANIISYGTEFRFNFRPVKDKLFFEGGVLMYTDKISRGLDATEKTERSIEYRFSAFYKPLSFFELYVERNYPYITTIVQEGTLNGVRVNPGDEATWLDMQDNGIVADSTLDKVGWRFRYRMGTLDAFIALNEKLNIYYERDNIWLSDRMNQPWKYGDAISDWFTYGIIYLLNMSPKVSFEGFCYLIPEYVKSNSNGIMVKEYLTNYRIQVKYLFSSQMSLVGYVSSNQWYYARESLSATMAGDPLANRDQLRDIREVKISFVYQP